MTDRTQPSADRATRRYDIDWLRIIAVLLLIPFHTARIFDIWEAFYVKNAQTNALLTYGVVGFLNQWHMPLFFLLAGASTWFALGFRSGRQYAMERLKRLFVPLLFGLLVIVPPQAYLARFQEPGYSGSYLQFLPDYFNVRGDLSGYTGLFTPGHLWFILFLFIYALISLPLFLYLKRDGRFVRWLAKVGAKPGGILLFVLPLIIASLFPEIGGKNLLSYLVFFIFGFILVSDPGWRKAIDAHKWIALVLGIVAMAVILTVYASGVQFPRFSAGDILFYTLRSFDTWFWLIALLGYGRQYLNRNNRVLQYASEAAYPFYILHQTVIIVIGFYVVRWPVDLWVKYLSIAPGSLIATLVVYDVLVRRTNITRFLFGMKPLKLALPAPRPAEQTAQAPAE
jgi:glucan biosynthesis protein C